MKPAYCFLNFRFFPRHWLVETPDLPDVYRQMKVTLSDLLFWFKIFHQDVKTENVLYNTRTKRVKLCNFGIACFCEDPSEQIMAVEIIHSGSDDMFSPERIADQLGFCIPR